MAKSFRLARVTGLFLPLFALACSGDEAGGDAAKLSGELTSAITAQGLGTVTLDSTDAALPQTPFDLWSTLLMADRNSPVVPVTGDLTESWTGADGKRANVVVRLPRTAGKANISVAPPGAGSDATPIFDAALAQLRAKGGGVLRVAPGEYRFKTANKGVRDGQAHLYLGQLTDVDIRGPGARFVFETNLDGIVVQDSVRVRLQGVTMRDARSMSGTGRIQANGAFSRLVLDEPLPDGLTINWVRPMNETTHTWPYSAVRAMIGPTTTQPTRIDDRTFQSPMFSVFTQNQFVSVKYAYYSPGAIYVRDSDTGTNEDITFDGIRIGTTGGMAILVRTRGRGIAVVNSTISADEGVPYSANYDGIHVVAAAGDLLIRNNSISHNGDDQINLRSLIHDVYNIRTDSATLANEARRIRKGDSIGFFDDKGDYIGRRTVSATSDDMGNAKEFTFEPGVSILAARFARDINLTPRRFAIVNNRLSDSSGRAILVQTANGTIRGNTIRVPSTAIRLLTSYGQWMEGAGAINVRITANTIHDGYAEQNYPYKFGVITSLAEIASNKLAASPQNGTILIENNRFVSPRATCVVSYATKNLTQTNNPCPSS